MACSYAQNVTIFPFLVDMCVWGCVAEVCTPGRMRSQRLVQVNSPLLRGIQG